MLVLSIVTPERQFLDVSCANVTLPGKLGEMQILPGHAAIMAELISGHISYEKENKETVKFMIGEGVVEVDRDRVNVLCEQARYRSEVDKSAEENLLVELKDQIKKLAQDDVEERRLTTELSRCLARLSLFEKV
jgi:F-type H+-transporting ATPase subunit epsilon